MQVLVPVVLLMTLLAGCGGGGDSGGNTTTSGSLALSSTPDGANIILDGSPTGQTTPSTLAGLSAETHQITLTKVGYPDYTQDVTVQSGVTTTVTAD